MAITNNNNQVQKETISATVLQEASIIEQMQDPSLYNYDRKVENSRFVEPNWTS